MTLLESLTVVSLTLGIIVIIGKYLVVLPLKNFIREQSYQIQPTANGGRSLSDVARTVDRIEKQLDAHIALHLKDGY